MREVFNNSKMNVTQGKKIQRRVRYDKLKVQFQNLIIQLCSKPQQSHSVCSTDSQSTGFGCSQCSEKEKELDRERKDHNKKIESYKEQVVRMRENIELFKESVQLLKE